MQIKKIFWLLFTWIILFQNNLSSQNSISSEKAEEKIELELFLEGKKITLDNNFEIFFVISDSIEQNCIKAKTDANMFFLPNLSNYENGIFAIKYKRKVYATYDYLPKFQTNNFILIIFDSKPYLKKALKDKYNRNIFEVLEYDNNLHKKETKSFLSVIYRNTRQTSYINNTKEYFNETKKLIIDE